MSPGTDSVRNLFHVPSLVRLAASLFLAVCAVLWLSGWLSSSQILVNTLKHLKTRQTSMTAVHKTVPTSHAMRLLPDIESPPR
jgi:hypothetical protein